MRKFLVLLIAAGLTSPAMAETETAPPMTMTIADGALTGDGADAIRAALEDTQFILIGEEHGFADSPEIAKALAADAWYYGFKYHVVEAGPISTAWTANILKRNGLDALGEALAGKPLALPFLNMREDAALAKFYLDKGGALWGVDQEFIGSTVLHLEALENAARNDDDKQKIHVMLEAEQNAFATGNQGALFMFTATDETFADLAAMFPNDKSALARIAALKESAAIYADYASGRNFKSNADRIDLIRRQFLDAYQSARGRPPRALFKMGAIHLGRGTTFLNTFDLGSVTEGIAAENGLSVMRILINPLEGEQTSINLSPDGPFATGAYRSEDVASFLNVLGIAEDAIPSEGWAVIPLAPHRYRLEQKGLDELNPEAKFFLLGYDYLITTRGAKGATPLAN